ncbi:MAG: LPP20 family lipoprotein [Bacteroidales bacterium]|nr:LPP20 family lipoprotein [Bacteroidales bacterium]
MKRFLAAALFLAAFAAASAQNYPQEWRRYTSDTYYHDIESAASKQAALEQARTNLARQIQVRVSEVSSMDKQAVNGRSSVLYSSQKSFSTDVDMSLAATQSHYNEAQGKHYVLVYIDKQAACTYYENEVKMLISSTDNTLGIAGNYIATGFKQKAKAELQKMLRQFDGAAKPFFWLNVFGFDERLLQQYLNKVHDNEQTAKQWLADLEYGTTYCVVCSADMFGKKYAKLANEVKGELASQGCNFVDNPSEADIVISITASARKYNEAFGAFFTYVDAAVSVDKTATGQRIFEDEVSAKGSHTLGYDDAARDGYKQITKEITKLLKENIKL